MFYIFYYFFFPCLSIFNCNFRLFRQYYLTGGQTMETCLGCCWVDLYLCCSKRIINTKCSSSEKKLNEMKIHLLLTTDFTKESTLENKLSQKYLKYSAKTTWVSGSSEPRLAAPSLTTSASLVMVITEDWAAWASFSWLAPAPDTSSLVSSTRALAVFRMHSLKNSKGFELNHHGNITASNFRHISFTCLLNKTKQCYDYYAHSTQ